MLNLEDLLERILHTDKYKAKGVSSPGDAEQAARRFPKSWSTDWQDFAKRFPAATKATEENSLQWEDCSIDQRRKFNTRTLYFSASSTKATGRRRYSRYAVCHSESLCSGKGSSRSESKEGDRRKGLFGMFSKSFPDFEITWAIQFSKAEELMNNWIETRVIQELLILCSKQTKHSLFWYHLMRPT